MLIMVILKMHQKEHMGDNKNIEINDIKKLKKETDENNL